jgi:hypothetical protein
LSVAAHSDATDNGNLLALVSSYTSTDGSEHAMADVWLARQVNAPTVSIEDVLTAPASGTELAALGSLSSHDANASATTGGDTTASSVASANVATGAADAAAHDAALAATATSGLLDDPNKHILI